MEVIDVTQSDWQEILDNVIKPYGWTTLLIVVVDPLQGTSPGFNSKNFETPGDKWSGYPNQYLEWTNQGRTFRFINPVSFRVLVRSRQL